MSETIIMNKRQFEELKRFYLSLGLSEKQAERLQKNVFNYTVQPDENTSYNENWCFCPQARPSFLSRLSQTSNPFPARLSCPSPLEYTAPPIMGANSAPQMMRAPSAPPPPVNALREADVPSVDDDEAPIANTLKSKITTFESPSINREMSYAPRMTTIPFTRNIAEAAEFNTAETHTADELPEMDPMSDTEVIFSANVNSASWSYVRNSVKRGRSIDPSFVRAEELISSFDYDIAAPKDKTFAVSTQTLPCPWNEGAELMFVGIKGAVTADKKPNHLVFLVDVSGSMQDDVLLEQMAVMALVSKLGKDDTMSIITYSNRTKTLVRNLKCGDMDKCIDAVLNIYFEGGGTFGSEGLTNAYELLSEYKDDSANNRIFIFTDGDFNFGISSEGGLAEFIKEKKKSGIYLSVVGYGMNNFKDNHMEALSRNGNGNYCFVGAPEDITERLFKQFDATVYSIAKDVKIKVEMNPEYVSSYRLIGYNARQLTKQDFDDTEKAVDGFGSGQNSAALIEFTRKNAKADTNDTHKGSRYTTTESRNISDEFAAVTIRFKTPDDVNTEQLEVIKEKELSVGSNAKIAAVLAAFGLEMSDSKYKGMLTKEKLGTMLIDCLNSVKGDNEKTVREYSRVFEKYINS